MARLVVLDRKLNQKHIEITDNIPDTIDIISPQKTNFEIRLNENLNVGDLVFVSNDKNDYLGIINETQHEYTTKLYTYPIISFTDCPVILNDINGDVFAWVENTLETNFITSEDVLFNLPLVVENKMITNATLKATFDSNNLFDALVDIFKKTGVYIDFELIFTDNGRPESILCKVKNNNDESFISMREDNPLIIKKPVYNFDYSGTNKVIFKPSESGKPIIVYLLKDNTLTTDADDENRIFPIVQEIQEYDSTSETISSDIAKSAEATMLGNINQFNIQLQLKANPNYPITPFRKFNLITEKSTYETYITKVVNHNDEYYDVVLGVVRNTLTDKLKEVSKSKAKSSSASSGGSGGSSTIVNDSLTSTSTTEALSANQGRVLKEYTDNAFTLVSINSNTGLFTFTRQNGTRVQIDTLLEKVVINFDYDESTQEIVLTLQDGTTKKIPMTAFIDDYTGVDGDIITISISNDNQITATIKNGTITLDKLTSDLQNLINQINNKANTSDLGELAYKDKISKSDVGLGNADNTSDIDKPISLATQQALDKKANVDLLPSNTPDEWSAKIVDYSTYGFESVGYGDGKFLVPKDNYFTANRHNNVSDSSQWNTYAVAGFTKDFETFEDAFTNNDVYLSLGDSTKKIEIQDIIYFAGRWLLLTVYADSHWHLYYPKDLKTRNYPYKDLLTGATGRNVFTFKIVNNLLFVSFNGGTTTGANVYNGFMDSNFTMTDITYITEEIRDVIYEDGKYIFLCENRIYTSEDLSSFTYRYCNVAFGTDGKGVIISHNGEYVINVYNPYSKTGRLFKGVTTFEEITPGFKLLNMQYNMGAFMFTSPDLTSAYVSKDLVNFEERHISDIGNSYTTIKVIYADGTYYIFGLNGTTDNMVATSTIKTFATTDASNLSTIDVEKWKEKLGVGEGGTKVIFAYYD
jgi:hypothetical protein